MIVPHNSGGWEVQDQDVSKIQCLVRACLLPVLKIAIFFLHPAKRESRERVSSHISSYFLFFKIYFIEVYNCVNFYCTAK